MNADKIKAALRHVHLSERCSTNLDGLPREDAEQQAALAYSLTREERATLRRALNLPTLSEAP